MNAETVFEAERARLLAIATRILDSRDDANDVLQEAWLRFTHADHDEIDVLPAWLTTAVTRLCLDHLRKRATRSRAEGEGQDDASAEDPQADALIAEQVDQALRVVMETLAPAERVAFVLHDVFSYSFDEIGAVLGRSEIAVRQLASRARRKVQGTPEPDDTPATRAEHHRVVNAFLGAARGGDLTTMLSLLAPDAVMRADAVGIAMGTDPVYDGAAAVAARMNGAKGALPVTIDGDLGAAWIAASVVKVAFVFHVAAGLVREVELIADPDTLATMDVSRDRSTATERKPNP